MSVWPATLNVKVVSELMSSFSPTFSGALVNNTDSLPLQSFARKGDSVAAS